jgi:hypothetical protein
MKREENDFEKAIIRMVGAIWNGKHFWFFPKPIRLWVKASANIPHKRDWLFKRGE